jgi:CBS domain-containing protein
VLEVGASEEAEVREPDVASVMTTEVVTASPDTLFRDVVETLTEKRVSAVPVVDVDGRPIGVVSEADVLAKQEFHGGSDDIPHDRAGRDRWYRALAHTAGELMTTPVRAVHAQEPLSVAARLLAVAKVRRLFVTDEDGRLVGVVSRRDLLRVYRHSDDDLRARAEARLAEIGVRPGAVGVRVDSGVITVDGELSRRGQVDAAARALPGVVAVRNNLRYLVDDVIVTGSGGWTGFSP